MPKIFNLFSLLALLVALLGGAVTSTPVGAAGVLYAKTAPTGSGNCTSWTNACTLQTALTNASAGDQIWVKAGTYIPNPFFRVISFNLKNGVAIYGGFAGTETLLSQRNPAVNVTILSGDLAGNDSGFTNNGENSYHVLWASNTDSNTRLDGFTIRGGNAEGTLTNGSGMYNDGGSPTLANVIFSGNFAIDDGSGMYNNGGSPTLTNVTFSGNYTTNDGGGGGMYNNGGSPTLLNVIFSNNLSGNGGGMFNLGSSPTLTNVTFSGNSASNGAGMYNHGGSPTLTNVTFSGNSAQNGGGMYNFSASSPTLTNVTFSSNSATGNGGGMYNGNSSPNLTNVTISGNFAATGGGMSSFDSSPMLANVTFSGNSGSFWGGGIYNSTSSPRLINTLIANSLNGGDCVNLASTLGAFSSNNLIEDASNACGLTNGVSGNIVGVDPKLGPLANNGGLTRTHAPLGGSPAIDKGTNANCPSTDQRGVNRPWGNLCDIGAVEFRTFTISGNAGTAGVTLSYTDGTSKVAISQSTGNYALAVSNYWSGTVTPSHPCFTFSPGNRNYNNVASNLTAQDYSPLFISASGCAQITVKFAQGLQGTYGIPKNSGSRLSYPNVDSGPVFVNGINSVPFIASERVAYKIGNTWLHFSEMMGLPTNLKSIKYAFPAYDNSAFDSQLRFGNVGNTTTTVHVYIAGKEMTSGCVPSNSPYTLAAGASRRVSCTANSGPVVIKSDGGVPLVASLRVRPKTFTGSYSEIMGAPANALGLWSTSYLFPWYNNVELNTQLRVANVGANATTVTVAIPGMPAKTFSLASSASARVSYPGVNGGPLRVSSSGGVPIVASLRVAFQTGNTWTAFSEMMGFPESQLDAGYVFPWYNNIDLNSQLRIANLSSSAAIVHVSIGGQEVVGSPFTLAVGTSIRKFYAVDSGPVVVRSEGGKKILASLRVLFPKTSTPYTSFSELMGLPESQLTTNYLFPWYNNKDLNTQLRLGVP